MEKTADRVVQFLVDHGRCTDCGGRYNLEDVYVLAQRGSRVFELAAVCRDCYTLSFIRAIIRPRRAGVADPAVAFMHELTPAEARRFDGLPPVEMDDVLDVSAFLARFDGDFRSLFGQEADEGEAP